MKVPKVIQKVHSKNTHMRLRSMKIFAYQLKHVQKCKR